MLIAINIKVGKTLNEALADTALAINNKGGLLKVISRVSDKVSGERGHPIQWDNTNSNWYINVATASTENSILAVPLIIEFKPPCPDCIRTTIINKMLIIVCIVIKN